MEDSNQTYDHAIIKSISLIDDNAFKERIARVCELYLMLEIGLKVTTSTDVPSIYNILINQEMNTIKDIESICRKIEFVIERIQETTCPGCKNCAPKGGKEDTETHQPIFH